MYEHILRFVEQKTIVLPAYQIAHLGWGREIKTGKAPGIHGVLITSDVIRTYRMSCGCVIGTPQESGAPCSVCKNEYLLHLAMMSSQQIVSINQEELNWQSTPCKQHYRYCGLDFCNAGCCMKHSAQLPDMRFYCLPHYLEIQKQLEYERNGFAKMETARFISSLFLSKP